MAVKVKADKKITVVRRSHNDTAYLNSAQIKTFRKWCASRWEDFFEPTGKKSTGGTVIPPVQQLETPNDWDYVTFNYSSSKFGYITVFGTIIQRIST